MEPLNNHKRMVNARTVLWYLIFVGFAVNYIIRINFNIAVVSMVKSLKVLRNNSDNISSNHGDEVFYDWSSQQQNVILGAFFWLHWATGVLGGVLALRYGTKQVFGLGNFIPTILCFFIPIAASLDYRVLIALRVVQGLFTGMCWSSINCLIAKWAPPHERSRFVSALYGSSVGCGLTYFISGVIINYFGWKYVFYVTGIFCTIWYIFWHFLVYETPEEHPSISSAELNYILEHTKESVNKVPSLPIPWKAIMTSKSIWIATYTYWGILWSILLFQTYMPLYFNVIHELNPEQIGIVLSIPNVTKWLFSFFVAVIIDHFVQKDMISTTNSRKIATTLATSVQGLMIVLLAVKGNDSVIVAVITVVTATTLQGASSSGILTSLIDMSPNFSSILYGVCSTVASTSGFIIPYVFSFLLEYSEPKDQWENSFYIVVIILVFMNILYVLFGDSEIKEWNSQTQKYVRSS